ncbi:MAG: acyltransferase [Phycisphaerales bacterium]
MTRLEPPYIFNLVVLTAILIVLKHQPAVDTLKHLAASIFYCHYYVYHDASTINGVAWSLEVEVQFYILAPLLSMVFIVRPSAARRALIVAAAVASCLAQAAFQRPLWHGFGIWNQLHFFLVGFLLADFYLTDWKDKPRSIAGDLLGVAGWVGLAATLLCLVRPGDTVAGPVTHLCAFVCVFAAYAGAFRGTISHRIFSLPFLFLIGGMCYTVYLWHYVVISLVGGQLLKVVHSTGNPGADLAIYFVALFPLVVAVSAVLFVLVEKPCMKKDWPQRLLAFVTRRPAAPSAH